MRYATEVILLVVALVTILVTVDMAKNSSDARQGIELHLTGGV